MPLLLVGSKDLGFFEVPKETILTLKCRPKIMMSLPSQCVGAVPSHDMVSLGAHSQMSINRRQTCYKYTVNILTLRK